MTALLGQSTSGWQCDERSCRTTDPTLAGLAMALQRLLGTTANGALGPETLIGAQHAWDSLDDDFKELVPRPVEVTALAQRLAKFVDTFEKAAGQAANRALDEKVWLRPGEFPSPVDTPDEKNGLSGVWIAVIALAAAGTGIGAYYLWARSRSPSLSGSPEPTPVEDAEQEQEPERDLVGVTDI